MENKQDGKNKSVAGVGSADAGTFDRLAEVLGAGVWVVGKILAIEPVGHVSGTNAKGKPYSFYSRRMSIFTGDGKGVQGTTVLVSQTGDHESDFGPLELFSDVRFRAESCRMDGSQMVFRVALG